MSRDYAAELRDVDDGLRAGVTLVGLAPWDSVRSQMEDAARKTGQLEASVQEVAKQV